ncbi:TrkA family protein [Cytobacillus firmus]|uniref:TrkA family protein n=2 Tax=Cytobacillus TaxID=2675230 RepID=A0A366K0Z7_CYTFI|nr:MULTISPECIES: NAD-binding protein [Cytobacillus]RBP95340.1 TrkA family protein [Cytobacillus firmus]TDX44181.1 TrkA family protein [Cytobacillus oceanisediminis]
MTVKKLDNTNILIIGWNERAMKLIEIITAISNVKINIIDCSVRELPYSSESVEYIYGNPMFDETLKRAGIKDTNITFITADRHSSETVSDSKSVISLLAIKSLNPSVFTIIEILSDSSIENAKRAGADEVIYTSEIFSNTIINSLSGNS